MKKLTGAEILLRSLRGEGVDTIFGYPVYGVYLGTFISFMMATGYLLIYNLITTKRKCSWKTRLTTVHPETTNSRMELSAVSDQPTPCFKCPLLKAES